MKKIIFHFSILSFIYVFQLVNSIIVVPFKINSYTPKKEGESNITDLINEYLVHDMFTTIEIGSGSNSQKVTTLISQEKSFISLSSDICKRKSFETINDLSIVSKRSLDINSYNTEIINKKYDNYLDEENNIGIIYDLISMYNTMHLSCQPKEKNYEMGLDTKININNISLVIKDKTNSNNDKLCAILGIGSPALPIEPEYMDYKLQNIPHFINFIKDNIIICDYSWTFKFHSKQEGRLIIGDLPHNYEIDTNYYNEDKLVKIKTSSPDYNVHPWSFHFKEVTFNSNNETIYVGKWIFMNLVPNIGFIISEDKYKNLILEYYFQQLIDKKICVLEKTNITKYTEKEIYFGTSGIYEIFHCDKNGLNKEKIVFPKLNFILSEPNHIFSLSFNNLFELINDRYYFLVIFPEDIKQSASKAWYLGLPFYYSNQFVFNYDSKTIGIYDQNIPIEDKDPKKKDEKENNDNNKSGIWKIIIEVICIIILVIIAFFVGKKINEQRKKRANELKDDNYDYTANEDTNINGTEENLVNN